MGNLRRIRRELRDQLTPGERAFWYGMVVLVIVLPLLAIGLLFFGGHGARAAGIALLFAALVVYAVPVSPILRGAGAPSRGRGACARGELTRAGRGVRQHLDGLP
jgi:hypothetical protein